MNAKSDSNPYYIKDPQAVGDFVSAPFLQRYPENPILTKDDLPFPSSLVFNCSVIETGDGYLMMYRNDVFPKAGVPSGGRTNLGLARSADGVHWTSDPAPLEIPLPAGFRRLFDPRLIMLEGRYCMTCCAVTTKGSRAAMFLSDDLKTFELVDLALPASRNTVVFPEKVGGKYWRLERPFWEGPDGYAYNYGKWFGSTFDMWVSCSPDLEHWGHHKLLLDTADVPYANIKIGPGAPPIKTDAGWLLLIHGVDFDPSRGKNGWEDRWPQRYHAGVALVDLEDPSRLIGFGQTPLITPEADYETDGGYRNNVVFPMTGIVKGDDVMIYYGAADTVVCLATAPLKDLLASCESV